MSNSNENKMRVRYDAEGRACTHKQCKPVKVDADHLRTIATEIYVTRTRRDLSDQERAAMQTFIRRVDGDLPTPTRDHPAFWAGIFLGALRRHETDLARDAARAKADAAHKADLERQAKEHMDRVVARAIKGTSATVGARKSAEADARAEMQRASREAWKKTMK